MKLPFTIGLHDIDNLSPVDLREYFLIETIFMPDSLGLTYTPYDQLIVGGAMPAGTPLTLPNPTNLKASYFLEHRELGALNVGGAGRVVVDGQCWELAKQDCLYVGRGSRELNFESLDAANPAKFYLLSAPAHCDYPTVRCTQAEATPVEMGTHEMSNECTVYQYIFQEGIRSCQLLMGLTQLKPASRWNAKPSDSYAQRTAAYFYFSLPQHQRVLHLLSELQKTRQQRASSEQTILLPPWSVHMGGGPSAYAFIWGMAGENHKYPD